MKRTLKLLFGWVLSIIGGIFIIISAVALFIDPGIATTIGILVFFGVVPFIIGYLLVKSEKKEPKKKKAKRKPKVKRVDISPIPLLPPKKHHIIGFSKDVEPETENNKIENKPNPPHNPLAEYLIEYVDSTGNKTEREIRVITSYLDSIEAYCYLRNANRTFNRKRIAKMIDLITGEIVNPETNPVGKTTAEIKADKFKNVKRDMKLPQINTAPLKKMLEAVKGHQEKREAFLDKASKKWFESDKYELFEDDSSELDDIYQLLDELIDTIEEWNNKR